MNLQEKIHALEILGQSLASADVSEMLEKSRLANPWFTEENTRAALDSVIRLFLKKESLEKWARNYRIPETQTRKKVGLVLAGNIPLVGFHDILCVFMANHQALIKYSEKDNILIPWILDTLATINPSTKPYFTPVDKIADYDAVIATGSNNTARYFSYYFRHVPHIIRKNRNAVSILTGNETREELEGLAKDIFLFFGLGCRNVSKIFVPEGYDFNQFFYVLDDWKHLAFHNKYKNNLDYNHALFLLNKQKFLAHEVLLLVESPDIASRVACLHYEYYSNPGEVKQRLAGQEDEIQCIVSHDESLNDRVHFGEAQNPSLDTYADNIDTMSFLVNLHSPD